MSSLTTSLAWMVPLGLGAVLSACAGAELRRAGPPISEAGVEASCAYNCKEVLEGVLARAGVPLIDSVEKIRLKDVRPFLRLNANMESGVAKVLEVRYTPGQLFTAFSEQTIAQLSGWVSGSTWSRGSYEESAIRLTNALLSSQAVAARLQGAPSRLAALSPTEKTASGPSGKERRIAVLEFASPTDARIDRLYFSDLARSSAVKSLPTHSVMSRENMEVLLSTAGKSISECEGPCEVDTGRRLGADYVVTGRISRIGSLLTLTLQLYATENGRLLASENARGRNVDELVVSTQSSLTALFRPLANDASE